MLHWNVCARALCVSALRCPRPVVAVVRHDPLSTTYGAMSTFKSNGVTPLRRDSVDPVLPYGGSVKTQQLSDPVIKPYGDVAPEVKYLVQTMFGIYTARGHKELSKVYDRFQFNCVFDLPFFFCRGADRMRVLTNLLSFAFDKVEARPKAVNLQLINAQMALIDVDAELDFHPRARWLPFASLVVPETVKLQGTWTIVTGEDEKIVNVTEVLHNLPFLPQLLRAVWTTFITTAGLAVSGW